MMISQNILALDLSTEVMSITLFKGNKVFSCYEHAPRQHNELVLGVITRLLKESGLSQIKLIILLMVLVQVALLV